MQIALYKNKSAWWDQAFKNRKEK